MFKKSPLKKRLGTFSIIIIAILAAIALSVPTYIVFDWCNNNVKLSFTLVATIYSGILYSYCCDFKHFIEYFVKTTCSCQRIEEFQEFH